MKNVQHQNSLESASRRAFTERGNTRNICEKNKSVHGEDAKRLLAYSPNTPRDIKLTITQLIMGQNEKNLRFFLSVLDRFD